MQISSPNFAFFTVESPSVTERPVSQENAFEKSKNPSPFSRKTISLDNSFTLTENNFSVFFFFFPFFFFFFFFFFLKIAKFEFMVTVHYSL